MKKYIIILLVMIVTLTTTGCDPFGFKDRAEEKQASKNAIKYFKEKYNMDVKVESAKTIRVCSPFCSRHKDVRRVTVKYNDIEAEVIISDADDNYKNGYDNYQNYLIEEEVTKYLHDSFNLNCYKSEITYKIENQNSKYNERYLDHAPYDFVYDKNQISDLFEEFDIASYCELDYQSPHSNIIDDLMVKYQLGEKSSRKYMIDLYFFDNKSDYDLYFDKDHNSKFEYLAGHAQRGNKYNRYDSRDNYKQTIQGEGITLSSISPNIVNYSIVKEREIDVEKALSLYKKYKPKFTGKFNLISDSYTLKKTQDYPDSNDIYEFATFESDYNELLNKKTNKEIILLVTNNNSTDFAYFELVGDKAQIGKVFLKDDEIFAFVEVE